MMGLDMLFAVDSFCLCEILSITNLLKSDDTDDLLVELTSSIKSTAYR